MMQVFTFREIKFLTVKLLVIAFQQPATAHRNQCVSLKIYKTGRVDKWLDGVSYWRQPYPYNMHNKNVMKLNLKLI